MNNYLNKEQDELLNMKDTINTLLNRNIVFKESPTIKINNIYFNTDMFIITSIFIVIWILTWWLCGFFNLGHYTIIFFFAYIFVGIFNIFQSPITDEANTIFSISKYDDVVSKGETFLSIIIILYIFVFTIKLQDDCRHQIYKVLTVILIFACFLLFRVKFRNNSRNLKNLIIVEKKIINQIIILFLLCVYLIFICQKNI